MRFCIRQNSLTRSSGSTLRLSLSRVNHEKLLKAKSTHLNQLLNALSWVSTPTYDQRPQTALQPPNCRHSSRRDVAGSRPFPAYDIAHLLYRSEVPSQPPNCCSSGITAVVLSATPAFATSPMPSCNEC